MLKDIGFWDINGNYIEDIQEITMEEEMELLKQENLRLKDVLKNIQQTISDVLFEFRNTDEDIPF